MPSTYSTRLRLELQGIGENANTWGDKANTVFRRIEEAVTGVLAVSMGTSVSAPYDLSYANGASDQARYAYLVVTGQLASSVPIRLSAIDKAYWVNNQTSGQPLLMGVAGLTPVTLANGWNHIVTDGSATYRAAEPLSIAPGAIFLTETSASAMFALKAATNTFTAQQTFRATVVASAPFIFTSTVRYESPLTNPPILELYANQVGFTSATAGAVNFAVQDLLGTKVQGGGVRLLIESAAAASVQTRLDFMTKSSVTAAVTPAMHLKQGLYFPGVIGGDKGAGTINATALLVNGVSVLTSAVGVVSVSAAAASGITLHGSISNSELLLCTVVEAHAVYVDGILHNTTGALPPSLAYTLQRAFTTLSKSGNIITFTSHQYYLSPTAIF